MANGFEHFEMHYLLSIVEYEAMENFHILKPAMTRPSSVIVQLFRALLQI